MKMPCVKCACSELKLAKHLYNFLRFDIKLKNPVLGSIWLRFSSTNKAFLNTTFGLFSKVNHIYME